MNFVVFFILPMLGVTGKNGFRKVAFLLKKPVVMVV